MKYYKAPWGKLLRITSTLATAVCLGVSAIVFTQVNGKIAWLGLLPVLLTPCCALFTIRGYSISPDAILVHRLLWKTVLPRKGLVSARFEANAMRWSVRVFGNGGFFSITGAFWSKQHGRFRAYVTDLNNTVVLGYEESGTVVLSPEAPKEFVCDLEVSRYAKTCVKTHSGPP